MQTEQKLVEDIEKCMKASAIWGRMAQRGESHLLLMFPLYYSYLVANKGTMGIADEDALLDPAAVAQSIGVSYTLGGFFERLVALRGKDVELPRIDAKELVQTFPTLEVLRDILAIAQAGQTLLAEDESYAVARAILVVVNDRFPRQMGRYGADCTTPGTTARLFSAIANPAGRSVEDFACGCGTSLAAAAAAGAASLHGWDIDRHAVLCARINCFFATLSGVDRADDRALCNIGLGDLTDFGNVAPGAYDVVMVAPPLGTKPQAIEGAGTDKYRNTVKDLLGWDVQIPKTMDELAVARALADVNDDGVVIMHTTKGVLFRESNADRGLRNNLIEHGSLYAVIELPSGTAAGTAINMCVLVFGRKRRYKDILLVNMADESLGAKGFYDTSRGPRSYGVTDAGIAWLKGVLERREEIEGIAKLITESDYREHGETLVFAQYGLSREDGLSNVRAREDVIRDIDLHAHRAQAIGQDIETVLTKL